MIRNVALLLAIFLIPVGALAHELPAWNIDAAHSTGSFTIRHILTPLTGTFGRISGTLTFDPDDYAHSTISVKIPIASINTGVAARDSHLASADFFDAASCPEITFVGDTFLKEQGDKYIIAGTLTIHGISRKVALPFVLHGIQKHPSKPNTLVAGATAELTVKRSDYGVGSGRFAETAVIGDDVKIVIGMEATRPNPPQ